MIDLIFPNFHSANVLVVGDIMLDRYIYGDVSRISPEAPVPVVKVEREESLPGGAANVAVNLVSLGANTALTGVTANDSFAKTLDHQLSAIGVQHQLNQAAQETIVKTRVMGAYQQLLRIDREEHFAEDLWQDTFNNAKALIENKKVIVLSDYAKGSLANCQQLIQLAKENSVSVLVDPKGKNFKKYRGADCLTPNLGEFIAVAGEFHSEAELNIKAQQMIEDYTLGALLLTRSEKGMTLFRKGAEPFHLPAITKAVADVTGAGDTVIATLAAALAAGSDIETAVTLSNIAASIVVSKVGTSAISAPELELECHQHRKKSGTLSIEQLQLAVQLAKARGEKVVFTNGCFDILHAGHVAYLKQARALGDRLIVAINSDESVTALKGVGRPINSLERRMTVLAGLQSVDWVAYFETDTPEKLLEQLQPDILVKGGDYSEEQVVGKEIVHGYGGEVKVMSLVPDCSTTQIVKKIQS